MDVDQAALAHVRQQDPDHAQREVQVGGQIGHGRREAAQAQQRQVLGLEVMHVGSGAANGGDMVIRSKVFPFGRVRPPVSA
jgi:hypothetical protein